MDSITYMKKLEQMYEKNFQVIKDRTISKKKYDLYAHYKDIAGRTLITKNDIIDKFEVNEYCLVKKIDNLNEKIVGEFLKHSKSLIKEIVKPHVEHKKSNITLILLCKKPLFQNTVQAIKKFKCEKTHCFYFCGITEVRLVVIDLEKEKVYTSKKAKELEKIYLNKLENVV
ncbi:hypothetical protein [Clostridium senegalense]|uniref:hypothetical protein n=1 Tax=Clostridium senegalense TaxID=1465809 RepID=UPI001C0FB177|nr:hypothetical protein [Clostridium senegalense]MBU5226398.1 hypothetical protein [Clostridium senegalense]